MNPRDLLAKKKRIEDEISFTEKKIGKLKVAISDQLKLERDQIISKYTNRGRRSHTLFEQVLMSYMESVQVQRINMDNGRTVKQGLFRLDETNKVYNLSRVGVWMEQIDGLLKSTNAEVQESKKILQELTNEISAISEIIQPQLVEQIKTIRSSRMSAVNEVKEILASLKEIRKFFLESDYSHEVERLERFVSICKELRRLKEDGTLDAVADVSIRLAIKEESHK